MYLLLPKKKWNSVVYNLKSYTQHLFLPTQCKLFAHIHDFDTFIIDDMPNICKIASYINSSWSKEGATLYSELSFEVLLGTIILFTADYNWRRANEITAVAIQNVSEEMCWCATPLPLDRWICQRPSFHAYCIEVEVTT